MTSTRNQPCHCGSGKKYKKCCLVKDKPLSERQKFKRFQETLQPYTRAQLVATLPVSLLRR
jgi:hypothetical protein